MAENIRLHIWIPLQICDRKVHFQQLKRFLGVTIKIISSIRITQHRYLSKGWYAHLHFRSRANCNAMFYN